ncbi:hypothetical protein B9Z19DRAFT_996902 [Tuber borchii]|uniref:Beta/gamma crystallin 'Greek key' domain-containing protein n=1 Tax=Tuber borchii TaxID=42251 RepID=A0A2T6ZHF5_TUBBO|nr:hypothetical protein B9Z19DRAFT_996902 [Tuber borchii]
MQAKVFLSFLLAAILALGVIAIPVDVEDAPPADGDTVVENAENPASLVGAPDPRPTEPIITPKEGDVLAESTSVVARDLESLEKRTPGCATITINPKFGGFRGRACSANGRCANLGKYWSKHISSFGPDYGTICILFTGRGCSGSRSIVIEYPGYGRLGKFDNNVGSFKCWW